jgi:hypothetical protein
VQWACLLALARLGNVSATNDLLQYVKQMTISDATVHQVFPDLVYTRSKVIFDFMVELLFNKTKNCLSSDSDQEDNIPCAYPIMELLAPAIKGYPLKQDLSEDITATNYSDALESVCKWFKKNDDFKIDRTRY